MSLPAIVSPPQIPNGQEGNSLPQALARVSAHVSKLLHGLGENSQENSAASLPRPVAEINRNARALLSSRAPLPQYINAAANEIASTSFTAYIPKVLLPYASFVMQAISSLFTTIYNFFQSLSKNSKSLEEAELKSILTTFKYDGLLSAKAQITIEQAYHANTLDTVEREITALIGAFQVDPEDQIHIMRLQTEKKILPALRHLHTLSLLNTLNIKANEWKDYLNQAQKADFAKAAKAFRESGSTKALNVHLVNITSRLQTAKWFDELLKADHFKESAEIDSLKEAASGALQKNDSFLFAQKCLEIIKHKDAKKNISSLELAFLADLQSYLEEAVKNKDVSIFKKIALQHSQNNFLTDWDGKAQLLLQLLKNESFQQQIDANSKEAETVEGLMNSCLDLYAHYGKLLEAEETNTLSKIHFAARFGNSVDTWRKINEQFLSFSQNLPKANEKGHMVCSCLFGRHVHKKCPDSKWKALPEKIKALSSIASIPEDAARKEAKSVLFLTCTYGGGHMSATNALMNYTKEKGSENDFRYHFRSLNLPLDVLLSKDPLQFLGKDWHIDWLYNSCMTNDRCQWIDRLKVVSNWLKGSESEENEAKEKRKTLVREAILKEKPDLIMLTYHMEVVVVTEVAAELGIPIVAVSTDFDSSDIAKANMTKFPKLFKTTVFSNIPKVKESLGSEEFQKTLENRVVVTGPPLRPEFLKPYTAEELQAIRLKKGIADDEKVILFTSGSAGLWSQVPETFAKWNNPQEKVRIICVCGENESFAKHIEEIVIPSIRDKANVKIEVQRNAELKSTVSPSDMADLMNIAHIVIGKPGGATTSEVVHTGARFIGDQTGYRFEWEKFNNDVIVESDAGDKITSTDELINIVEVQLKKPRPNAKLFPQGVPYSRNFTELMAKMIRESEQDDEYKQLRASWMPQQPSQAVAV